MKLIKRTHVYYIISLIASTHLLYFILLFFYHKNNQNVSEISITLFIFLQSYLLNFPNYYCYSVFSETFLDFKTN